MPEDFTYDPDSHGSVAEFCQRHSPLKVFRRSDPPAWLWVRNPADRRQSKLGSRATAEERGKREIADFYEAWEDGDEDLDPDETMEELHNIAREEGYTSGKWMLFPEAATVERDWLSVCEGTASDQLGSSAAKVGASKDGSFLICVYVADFSNVKTVRQVLAGLSTAGVNFPPNGIYFKSDMATTCGIYSRTPLFYPSMYHATRLTKGAAPKLQAFKNNRAARKYLGAPAASLRQVLSAFKSLILEKQWKGISITSTRQHCMHCKKKLYLLVSVRHTIQQAVLPQSLYQPSDNVST
ncbi:hypothetical protein WJX73_007859 [Symbiochloris irregularis]|uniref:LAGLIDADG homing endonuclease n=1 Tax=Symbiochloris irregularis TaxID=706552 RepID=A0AAW1PF39_9CHLO